MERRSILIASLITLLANAVTHMEATRAGEPIAGVKSFDLSAEQEQQLTALANQGDNEAAVRLANFYDFVRQDSEKAMLWFRKAAQNGDASAQYNLGYRLSRKKHDEASRKEAIFWLQEADRNGAPLAKSLLEELHQSSK